MGPRIRRSVALLVLATAAWLTPAGRASAALTATDVAQQAGIAEGTTSWSVTVADLNADGLPDFLLGRHIDVAQLFHDDGGRFTEIDAGTFVRRDRHDCATADANLDGLLDIYCSVGALGGRIEKANELWMQQPDGTFVNRADAFGVTDPLGRGRRVTFIDVNHDRYPDLFVGNASPRMDGRRSPNRLFLNDGGTRFREDRASGLTVELGAQCVQAVDYDGDGWQDLLVCGKDGRPLRLYRNDHHDTFVNVTARMGIRGQAESAQLVDVNGDGRLDLVRVRVRSVHVRLGGTLGFGASVLGLPLRAGAWLAIGDATGDGSPDLYVVQGCRNGTNRPDLLLVNDGTGRFTSVPTPEATVGCGGYAAPIDDDGDGRADFIVLNGQGRFHHERVVGPVQLISLGP